VQPVYAGLVRLPCSASSALVFTNIPEGTVLSTLCIFGVFGVFCRRKKVKKKLRGFFKVVFLWFFALFFLYAMRIRELQKHKFSMPFLISKSTILFLAFGLIFSCGFFAGGEFGQYRAMVKISDFCCLCRHIL